MKLAKKIINSLTTLFILLTIFLIFYGAFSLLRNLDIIHYRIMSNPAELFYVSVGSMLLLKSVQLAKFGFSSYLREREKSKKQAIKKALQKGMLEGEKRGKKTAVNEIRHKADKNLYNDFQKIV